MSLGTEVPTLAHDFPMIPASEWQAQSDEVIKKPGEGTDTRAEKVN